MFFYFAHNIPPEVMCAFTSELMQLLIYTMQVIAAIKAKAYMIINDFISLLISFCLFYHLWRQLILLNLGFLQILSGL